MRISEGFVGVEGALGLPAVSALSLLNGRGWVLRPVGTAGGIAHGDRRRGGFAAITRQVRVPIWMSHWQPKYIPRMPKLSALEHPAAAVFERSVPGAHDVCRPQRGQLRARVVSGVVGLGALVVLAWTAGHYARHNEEATSRRDVAMLPRIGGNVPSGNEGASAGRPHEDLTLFANAPVAGSASPAITDGTHERVASVGRDSHGTDVHARMTKIPVQQLMQPRAEPRSPAKGERQLVRQRGLAGSRNAGRPSSDRTVVSGARNQPVRTARVQEWRTPRFDAHSDAGENSQRGGATSRSALESKPVDATRASRTDSGATGWMEYMKQRRLTEVPQEFLK